MGALSLGTFQVINRAQLLVFFPPPGRWYLFAGGRRMGVSIRLVGKIHPGVGNQVGATP